MADPVPQEAHDHAAVVFSRSFRFVEWKFVIATPATSTPFGDRDGTQYQAVREIDRRKWIYAFRNNHEREQYADVYEEIRVDKNGDMAAVPLDKIGQGDPEPLGRTMCLPRRRFGNPLVYRFFASRVRLRQAQIKELKAKVTAFAPPVLLDPGDNLSVFEHKGQLLVPVVDPVTVALHLHDAFTAAADDIVNYTAAHKENSHRTSVERRRKKHLLATLLKSIIGEPSNTSANNLVNALKDRQWPLEDFLAQYDTQLQWRVERRDRMGSFLTRWLQSDAIRIAAAASKDASKESWPRFLTQWCQSITRLGESPPGRHYLDALLNDRTHFIHTYIWPQKKLPEDGVQAVRKGGMTIFEAWKTLAERKILAKGAKVGELVSTLEVLLLPTGKQLVKPIDQVVHYGNMLRTQETIRAVGVISPDGIKPARPFAAAPARFGAIVESINLVLAISSSGDKLASSDPRTRQLALIGLVGSSLDAASAIGSLMKNSQKVVATMSFVSGVIDVYLGHQELKNAFKAGDTDTANAVFITTAGSTVGVTGTFMALAAVPGAQIVAVVGLLIVAIGSIYKLLVSKDPIEVFFGRCSWGAKHLTPGKPDWTPTDFKEWQGEKEFDRQLEALLNIICKVEVTPGDTFRVLKCKMGWLPPYATLKVRYQEKWRDSAHDGAIDAEIELSDKGPRVTPKTAAVATPDGQNGVKIELKRLGKLTMKDPHDGPRDILKKKNVNLDLTSVEVFSRLIVSFDGTANVALPHSKPASTRFL